MVDETTDPQDLPWAVEATQQKILKLWEVKLSKLDAQAQRTREQMVSQLDNLTDAQSLTAQNLREAANQFDDIENLLRENNQEVRRNFDNLDDIFGDLDDRGALANLSKGAFEVQKFGQTTKTITQSFMQWDGSIAGLATSMGALGGIIGFGIAQSTNLYNSFLELNNIGQSFAGTISNMLKSVADANLTVGMFSKVMIENSQVMATFADNGQRGAEIFIDTQNAVREIGRASSMFGMNVEQIASFTADFLETQRIRGRLGRITQDRLNQETVQYIEALNELSFITGRSRDELNKQLQEQQRSRSLAVARLGLSQAQRDQLDASASRLAQAMAGMPPQLQESFQGALLNMAQGIPAQQDEVFRQLSVFAPGVANAFMDLITAPADQVDAATANLLQSFQSLEGGNVQALKILERMGGPMAEFARLVGEGNIAAEQQIEARRRLANMTDEERQKIARREAAQDSLTKSLATMQDAFLQFQSQFLEAFVNSFQGTDIAELFSNVATSLGELAGMFMQALPVIAETFKLLIDGLNMIGSWIPDGYGKFVALGAIVASIVGPFTLLKGIIGGVSKVFALLKGGASMLSKAFTTTGSTVSSLASMSKSAGNILGGIAKAGGRLIAGAGIGGLVAAAGDFAGGAVRDIGRDEVTGERNRTADLAGRTLQGATTVGGIGATIGTLIAPGIGTAIGGALGGVIGGGYSLIAGLLEDSASATTVSASREVEAAEKKVAMQATADGIIQQMLTETQIQTGTLRRIHEVLADSGRSTEELLALTSNKSGQSFVLLSQAVASMQEMTDNIIGRPIAPVNSQSLVNATAAANRAGGQTATQTLAGGPGAIDETDQSNVELMIAKFEQLIESSKSQISILESIASATGDGAMNTRRLVRKAGTGSDQFSA